MAEEDLEVVVRVRTEGEDLKDVLKDAEKVKKLEGESARSAAKAKRAHSADDAAARKRIDLNNKEAQSAERLAKANERAALAAGTGKVIAHPGGRYTDPETGRFVSRERVQQIGKGLQEKREGIQALGVPYAPAKPHSGDVIDPETGKYRSHGALAAHAGASGAGNITPGMEATSAAGRKRKLSVAEAYALEDAAEAPPLTREEIERNKRQKRAMEGAISQAEGVPVETPARLTKHGRTSMERDPFMSAVLEESGAKKRSAAVEKAASSPESFLSADSPTLTDPPFIVPESETRKGKTQLAVNQFLDDPKAEFASVKLIRDIESSVIEDMSKSPDGRKALTTERISNEVRERLLEVGDALGNEKLAELTGQVEGLVGGEEAGPGGKRPAWMREIGLEAERRAQWAGRSLTLRGAVNQAGLRGVGSVLSGGGFSGAGIGAAVGGGVIAAGTLGAGMLAYRGARAAYQSGSEGIAGGILAQRHFGADTDRILDNDLRGGVGAQRQFAAGTRATIVGQGFTGTTATGITQQAITSAEQIARLSGVRSSDAMEVVSGAVQGDFSAAQGLGLEVNQAAQAAKALEMGFVSLDSNSARTASSIAALGDAADEAAGKDVGGHDALDTFGGRLREKLSEAFTNIGDGIKTAANAAALGLGTLIGGESWQRDLSRNVRGPGDSKIGNMFSQFGDWAEAKKVQRSNEMFADEQMLQFIDPQNRISAIEGMMEKYPEEADRFMGMIQDAHRQRLQMEHQHRIGIENINIQRAQSEYDIELNKTRQIEQIEINHTRSREDIALNRARSLEDIEINHARSVEDIWINHARSIEDIYLNATRGREDLNISVKRQEEDLTLSLDRQMEDRAWSMEKWQSATERVFSTFGHSSQRVIFNLEDQNERFREWARNLEDLRSRGLSEDAVRVMELDNPVNESQVRQIAASTDEEIAQINRLIAERTKMANKASERTGISEREREEARAREDIMRGHTRGLEDMARNTARAVEDLNRNTSRSLADLERNTSRSVADLERNTSRAYDDLERNTTRATEDLNRNTRHQLEDLNTQTIRQMAMLQRSIYGGFRDSFSEVRGLFRDFLKDMGLLGEARGESVGTNVLKGLTKGFNIFETVRNLFKSGSASDTPQGFRSPRAPGDGYGFQGFANGGVEDHQAQIASAGSMRLWAEPETGGEAYIPLAENKRERSLRIWKETGKRLGVAEEMIEAFNNGGISNRLNKAARAVIDDTAQTGAAFFEDIFGGVGPALGNSPGWERMWDIVKKQFPNARLHSAYRPGAITATGNPSYHGMGRAIDISPRMDIFEWLRNNYMSQTKELIFSPANDRQVHNGRNHNFPTPITRAMHWDHIHWAMKNGGILDAINYGNGGVATSSHVGRVGESGKEAMVPLNNKGVRFLAQAIRASRVDFDNELTGARRDALGGGSYGAPGYSSGDVNRALLAVADALEAQAMTKGENNYGPITVQADDPRKMERELQARASYQRLSKPSRAGVKR